MHTCLHVHVCSSLALILLELELDLSSGKRQRQRRASAAKACLCLSALLGGWYLMPDHRPRLGLRLLLLVAGALPDHCPRLGFVEQPQTCSSTISATDTYETRIPSNKSQLHIMNTGANRNRYTLALNAFEYKSKPAQHKTSIEQ